MIHHVNSYIFTAYKLKKIFLPRKQKGKEKVNNICYCVRSSFSSFIPDCDINRTGISFMGNPLENFNGKVFKVNLVPWGRGGAIRRDRPSASKMKSSTTVLVITVLFFITSIFFMRKIKQNYKVF